MNVKNTWKYTVASYMKLETYPYYIDIFEAYLPFYQGIKLNSTSNIVVL